MSRLLLSVDDLSDEEISRLLDRARDLAAGAAPRRLHPVVGLLFFAESTRTRLGFAVAAARLGGSGLELGMVRDGDDMSVAESFEDTVRTVTGMTDVVVVRAPFDLDRDVLSASTVAPLVSGGHGSAEHPTQALIDVLAIEVERGALSEQRVTVCGDLTMRASRSLLRLLGRRPPAELVLVGAPGRGVDPSALPAGLSARTVLGTPGDIGDTDVLYLPGLPAGRGERHLDDAARAAYALTPELLSRLSPHAVVLCPLPAIDEVSPAARRDPRVRMFEQSDRAVALRIAVLEHLLT